MCRSYGKLNAATPGVLLREIIRSLYTHSEITFENAEELTEEGLPFLIMFHAPDDTENIKSFKTIVEKELLSEKRKFTFHFYPSNDRQI